METKSSGSSSSSSSSSGSSSSGSSSSGSSSGSSSSSSKKLKVYIVLHGAGVNSVEGKEQSDVFMGYRDIVERTNDTRSSNFATIRNVVGQKKAKLYRMCPHGMVFMSTDTLNIYLRKKFFYRENWQAYLHSAHKIGDVRYTPANFSNDKNDTGQAHREEEPFAPVLRTAMQLFEGDDEFLDEILETAYVGDDLNEFGVYICDDFDGGVWSKMMRPDNTFFLNLNGQPKRVRISDLMKNIISKKNGYDEYEFLFVNCSPEGEHDRKMPLKREGDTRIRHPPDSNQNSDYWKNVFKTNIKSHKLYAAGKIKFENESEYEADKEFDREMPATQRPQLLNDDDDEALIATNYLFCQMDDEERQNLYINVTAFLTHYPEWVENDISVVDGMKYLIRVLTTSVHDVTAYGESGTAQETLKVWEYPPVRPANPGKVKKSRGEGKSSQPTDDKSDMFEFREGTDEAFKGSKHSYIETVSRRLYELITDKYRESCSNKDKESADLYRELLDHVNTKGFPTLHPDKIAIVGSIVKYDENGNGETGVVVSMSGDRVTISKVSDDDEYTPIGNPFVKSPHDLEYFDGPYVRGPDPPDHIWGTKFAFERELENVGSQSGCLLQGGVRKKKTTRSKTITNKKKKTITNKTRRNKKKKTRRNKKYRKKTRRVEINYKNEKMAERERWMNGKQKRTRNNLNSYN